MKVFIAAAVAALVSLPVYAGDAKPLTVEACLSILQGLNALNCVGQQLGGSCAADAKQYKLGPARMTIAMDVSRLTAVQTAAIRAQQGFAMELPVVPQSEAGKGQTPEAAALQVANNKKQQENLNKITAANCEVSPGHIAAAALKLGDDADSNAIPPAVLAAIAPIIDQ